MIDPYEVVSRFETVLSDNCLEPIANRFMPNSVVVQNQQPSVITDQRAALYFVNDVRSQMLALGVKHVIAELQAQMRICSETAVCMVRHEFRDKLDRNISETRLKYLMKFTGQTWQIYSVTLDNKNFFEAETAPVINGRVA
jgi:rRNA maturation endonuclease Nob1